MDDGSIEASGLRIQSQDQLDMMEEGVAGGNDGGVGREGREGGEGKGKWIKLLSHKVEVHSTWLTLKRAWSVVAGSAL